MDSQPTPPPIFAVTIIPFAAAVGYVSIAAPFWLANDGVPLSTIGAISATAMLPHAIKFLWAPLLDLGAHRKIWFLCMTVLTAICLTALSFVPSPAQHLGLFTLVATLAQIAGTTASAAADGLMACTTIDANKGRAGGWRMAGNVGGTGVLGEVALEVGDRMHSIQLAGLALGILSLASCAALFFIHEPRLSPHGGDAAHHRSPLQILGLRLYAIGHDLWTTVKSREGWTGLVICAVPVGAGALTNLFSAMALEYKASGSTVGLVNGLVGGIAGAAGSLLGGWLADKMNRRVAYALSGGLTALAAIAMLVSPMNDTTYTWGVLAYSFANGIAFATLAAFILEMVGHSAAAATKYTLFIAIANVASSYVTFFDGAASDFKNLGARGSIAADAILTFLGIAVLLVMVRLARARPASAAPAVVAES